MTADESEPTSVQVGDYIVDTDRDDSDLAVVTRLPDATCAEWEIEAIDKTVAECNPDHPPDAPVAVVAFEDALNADVEGWRDADPESLHELVEEADVTPYTYPLPRLSRRGRAVTEAVRAWFDGACEPRNPGGHGTYGVVIRSGGEVVHEESGYLGSGDGMTNNVAEYEAVIAALDWIREDHPDARAVVHGDSELVVKQLSGEYAVRSDNLRPLWRRASSLASELDVEFRWVPREENERADALSVAAYEQEVRSEEIKKRRERAMEEEMSVELLDDGTCEVKGKYRVDLENRACTCPDYSNRGITCKHVFKAEAAADER